MDDRMHGRRSLRIPDEQTLRRCASDRCQICTYSGDLCECSRDCGASLWLPPRELRSQRLFTLIDERPDRLRV